MKKTLLIAYILLMPLYLLAQCESAYDEARESYDNGRPDLVEEILMSSDCLSKLPRNRQADALKLLVLASIFQDDDQKANLYIKKLLKLEPEYRLQQDDPIEFSNLFYSYRTDPALSLGISLQSNKSYIRNLSSYSIDALQSIPSSYSSPMPFVSGLFVSADIWLGKKWVLQSGVIVKQQNFEKNSTVLGFAQTKTQEVLTFVELPLNLRRELYDYKKHKLIAFAGAGYLFTNDSQLSATRRDILDANRRTLTSAAIDMTEKRQRHNVSLQAGLGVELKVKRGFWGLNLGYQMNVFYQNKSQKRFDNTRLTSEYFYVDDSFRLDNIFITFGYFYSFYKAKKIKYD